MFLLFPVRLLVLFVDTSLAVVLLLCFSVSRFFFSVFAFSASLLLRFFVYTGELLFCFFAFFHLA